MEELTKAQIAIVKEIEKLIVELLGGTEEQIWKKTFEKILKLVDEFELIKHKETIESIYDKFMKEGLYEYAGRFAAKCNL
jgi:acetyl-CoA carboxylase alpha subunit